MRSDEERASAAAAQRKAAVPGVFTLTLRVLQVKNLTTLQKDGGENNHCSFVSCG